MAGKKTTGRKRNPPTLSVQLSRELKATKKALRADIVRLKRELKQKQRDLHSIRNKK